MAGHIQGWGGEDVRLLDLFYKGGETIRGFDRAGLGPRDLLTGDALGGSTYWSTTAEVRFPLPFISEDLGMSGAFFVGCRLAVRRGRRSQGHSTAGCAPVTEARCLPADNSSVRASAGASILWNSPLGPLRLDIAKAFIKENFDEEQLIRFGASTKF